MTARCKASSCAAPIEWAHTDPVAEARRLAPETDDQFRICEGHWTGALAENAEWDTTS
jgi:hypothetical protein